MINYEHFGVMIDCSRNAVMNLESLKKFIDYISIMGYNTLELYTEDTYKIPDEPYFGYLRGGYTGEEIKEIDSYCKTKGIELIPCIQVLAHFDNLVKIPHYSDIVDIDNILLVDEPKTYELLEKIFKFLADNFSSRNVNIGMDEAHHIGLGKFLDKYGYQDRYDILLRHLNKVSEIAEKYGFKASMWSDMFFRLQTKGEYYAEDVVISQEIVNKMPKNIELIYWDYYHDNQKIYDKMFKSHIDTGKETWFAGGAWSWCGFAPFNRMTMKNSKPAMQSVLKNNVKNVIITMWGDDGKECSFFSLLPTLYTIKQYSQENFDDEKIKADFNKLFGLDYDSFILLDYLNCLKDNKDLEVNNLCKALLFNDCFLGILDKDYEEQGELSFKAYADKIRVASSKCKEFSYIFDTLSSLADILSIKATLGIRTRKAYKDNNIEELKNIVQDYVKTEELIKKFFNNFKNLWYKENKPFGFEIQEARIGGLILRINSCGERLSDYIEGKIKEIPELEEEILPYNIDLKYHRGIYKTMISTSGI